MLLDHTLDRKAIPPSSPRSYPVSLDQPPYIYSGGFVQEDYLPMQSKELLAKTLSQRLRFLKKSIDDIQALIQERQQLKDTLDSAIEKELSTTRIEIMQIEHMRLTQMMKRKLFLESQLAALNKEKRWQAVSCWQDKVALRRELRNVEKQFNTAYMDQWLLQFLS